MPQTSPKTQTPSKILIAIDGPAGAGKSTVAARLASHLGVPYLDTGAMYRTVALLALRAGLQGPLSEADNQKIQNLMGTHEISVSADVAGTKILVDGEDVSGQIRTAEVALMASAVSAIPEVRQALVPLQRRLGLENGGVMEGRDIGTVVLPDAQCKFYLTANAEERARRRHLDLAANEESTSLEDVLEQQRLRDLQDTSRAESPLQVARGSVVVDTSGLTLDEVVERLLEEAGKLLGDDA